MTYIERRNTKVYGASDTLDPNFGTHAITATSAATITLANPSQYLTGTVIEIFSTTAYSHIVSYSGGFGGDSAKATYTMRGAINDSLVLVAYNGLWYVLHGNTGSFATTQDYTADGAINTAYDLHTLSKAGVGAMTIAAPTAAQAGRTLHIKSTTAQAHTVTFTGGFGGVGTGGDVATFGGAIGDGMSVVAVGVLWYIDSLYNVTLG